MTTFTIRRIAALMTAGVATASMLCTGAAQARMPDDDGVAPTVEQPATVNGPAALFGALRQSPSSAVPVAVGRAIAFMPSSQPDYAAVPSAVHRSNVDGHAVYVAPTTNNGLCVLTEDGSSACSNDLAAIAKSGFGVQIVPPAPGRIDPMHPPTSAPTGRTTLYGVVPDGVYEVIATTTAGRQVSGSVQDNAFVLVADEPFVGDLQLGR